MFVYKIEIERFLSNYSDNTGIKFNELEKYFWEVLNNLRPKPYYTFTALLRCMDYNDIIEDYKEKGIKISKGAVSKQARRALEKIKSAFDEKYGNRTKI